MARDSQAANLKEGHQETRPSSVGVTVTSSGHKSPNIVLTLSRGFPTQRIHRGGCIATKVYQDLTAQTVLTSQSLVNYRHSQFIGQIRDWINVQNEKLF